MRLMIRTVLLVLTCAFTLGGASQAFAHQLTVFASVQGDENLVEAKFSTGKRPVSGEVRISDGHETLLSTLELGEDGFVSVPLSSVDVSSGLMIEVRTSEGHDDYWILTPEDLSPQSPSEKSPGVRNRLFSARDTPAFCRFPPAESGF